MISFRPRTAETISVLKALGTLTYNYVGEKKENEKESFVVKSFSTLTVRIQIFYCIY